MKKFCSFINMSNINRLLKIMIYSLRIILSCLSDFAEDTDPHWCILLSEVSDPHSTKYINTQTQHDNNTQTNPIEGSTIATDSYPLAHTYPSRVHNTFSPVDQSNYTRYLQNVPIEHMQIQPIGYTQNRSIEFIPAATIQQRSNQPIEHMQTNTQIEQTNN